MYEDYLENIFHKKRKQVTITIKLMFVYYNLLLIINVITHTKDMGNSLRGLNLSRSPSPMGKTGGKKISVPVFVLQAVTSVFFCLSLEGGLIAEASHS